MKIDVKVKNLGRIKEAEFKIRPMTVITGSNGTGKSFFTKSLYSILNILNKNVYAEAISKIIQDLQLQLSIINNKNEKQDSINEIEDELISLQKEFNEARGWGIGDFLIFTESKSFDVKRIYHYYTLYINKLKSGSTKINHIESILNKINFTFKDFIWKLEKPLKRFDSFSQYIENELKDNFQISSHTELISFDEKKTEILIEGFLNISFTENTNHFSLVTDFIDEVNNLSSVVFFESPAYWKVRDALKIAKEKRLALLSSSQSSADFLNGVPKYFYDLDDALNIKTKSSGNFKEIADSLEKVLGGEFIFKGDNLTFKDKKTGQEISKHLVSFGMTNLGMIHALLKHNIITEGSFVFIDEPETNLHPDWQLILMNALLALADKGVNIVITTHSTDILKSLEVGVKKRKVDNINEFLSVHFVDLDGYLLKFDSDAADVQLTEAISLLNSTYSDLYFSGL